MAQASSYVGTKSYYRSMEIINGRAVRSASLVERKGFELTVRF